jgi:hypothetical protein
MEAVLLWEILREKARLSEFEIHTVPQNKSIPLWFCVGIKDKHLLIKKAKNHTPSVKISMDRMITYKDFESVYQFYDLWLKDSSIRKDAAKKSQNTAYIFALIAEVLKEDKVI